MLNRKRIRDVTKFNEISLLTDLHDERQSPIKAVIDGRKVNHRKAYREKIKNSKVYARPNRNLSICLAPQQKIQRNS